MAINFNLKPTQPGTPEHRAAMAELGRQVNELAGIPSGPPMTPEELDAALERLHESQRKNGVRAEDNGGSRELLRMRYGEDYDPDQDE